MTYRHIVLDLDATIVHSIPKDSTTIEVLKTDPQYSFLKDRSRILNVVDILDNSEKGKGIVSSFVVILRPYVKEFLEYLLNNADKISIYSAGHKRYVRAIESIIFQVDSELYKSKLDKILTASDCEFSPGVVLKDLEKAGFKLEETLIIDDNPTTFTKNPHNVIHLPDYRPEIIRDQVLYDDRTLLKIMEWMDNNLRLHEDIRNTDKRINYR